MRTLAGWDLAAWRMAQADPALRATVVGIVELEDVVPIDDLLERIREVVSQNVILRSRVVEDESGAHFEEVPSLEINHHIEIPPTVIDVSSRIAEFAQKDFDLTRPLWRILIINTGRRTTIVCAFHHAISDGQSALLMLAQMLDEPPAFAKPSFAEQPPREQVPPLRQAMRPVIDRLMKDPVGLATDLNRVMQSVNSLLQIPAFANTAQRGGNIHFAAWECDKNRIEANINDVLIAVGVDLWHSMTYESNVVVNVPVSGGGGRGINQFTIARLRLKADSHNPSHVIADSHAALLRWRTEPAAILLPHIVELSQFLPAATLSSLVKQSAISVTTLKASSSLGSILNVPITNVIPLVSPTGVAVNITSIVMGSRLVIGVSADGAAISSRRLLITSFEQAASRVLGFAPTIVSF